MNKKRSIFLVGPMGAGKTSVGRQLAASLELDFVDTDIAIEQQLSASMIEIFQRHSEQFFRAQEAKILAAIEFNPAKIIATGGGCILDLANRQLMAQQGLVCYLQVSVEQQLQRLSATTNRALLPPDPAQRFIYLSQTILKRKSLYESIANYTVNTDNQTIRAVADQLRVFLCEQ